MACEVAWTKKNKKIAVIGLGYVGLPLAIEFGKKYEVLGFDINTRRVEELIKGIDRTQEADLNSLQHAMNHKGDKGLTFSYDIEDLKTYDIFIVTVPTPIDQFKAPDLTPLLKASEMLGKVLKKGDIVIYESTVYPGCTEEDCVPVLEKYSGLKFNLDFYCGYSPERINPGDKVNTLTKIKKVTSGSTPEIADIVDGLYSSIIEAGTHKAPSIRVAEAAKVIENSQRDINIAFVNELSKIFNLIGIGAPLSVPKPIVKIVIPISSTISEIFWPSNSWSSPSERIHKTLFVWWQWFGGNTSRS